MMLSSTFTVNGYLFVGYFSSMIIIVQQLQMREL